MDEDSICLKQNISEEDNDRINELKNICTCSEDIFLKLELDFKLNISRMRSAESIKDINEFFYYSGETLVGYLGICNFGRQTGELTGMVHPLYRRKGIFSKLCSLAVEECKRRNFKEILLVCDRRSSSSLEFIKSTGASYSFSEYEMRLEGNYESEGGNSITLRKAVNCDADEIVRQNYIYFCDDSGTVVMPEDEEKRNRITYMVELKGRVIGKIRVEMSDDEGFLSGFGILPEYRGRGYGRQALKTALNILNKNNINNAGLEVASENENALSLYRSCRFKDKSVTDYYEVK